MSYIPIASQTLTSAAASVTFSSIPQGFRDLVVIVNARSDRTADNFEALLFRLNSDTGNNYSQVGMSPDTSTGTSSAAATQNAGEGGRLTTSNSGRTAFSTNIVQFLDYAATDKHKPVLCRGSAPGENIGVDAKTTRWANTNAITTILLFAAQSGNFVTGSTFSLYGIEG